jgi:DNA-binding MurR/RpiR family transcriptional regulator
MEEHRWSEAQLAAKADVSQSTVSRALTREGKRVGRAQKRLFIYAKIINKNESREMRAKQRVISAVERIWGRSDQHAEAVAKIINALTDLAAAGTQGETPH